jgi:hypothetical protein
MSHFKPSDDLEHEIGTATYARESWFWVMPVPHEGIAGLVYLWRDGDTGRWGRFIGLGDSLATEPLFLDAAGDLVLEGEDMRDATIGGLRVRQPEPLKTAELEWHGDGVHVQCSMTALHAPFSWRENQNGCPDWAATDRYEQSLRTKGVFTVGDRTVEFESMGHRDHSWGPRDWRALQHWKWMNASTLDGELSLHAWIGFAKGDITYNGYVNRGGVLSPINFVYAEADLDENFMHTAVRAKLTTEDGGELQMDTISVAGLPIPARQLRMNEIACHAKLDGSDAIAHIELGWPQSYIADYTG